MSKFTYVFVAIVLWVLINVSIGNIVTHVDFTFLLHSTIIYAGLVLVGYVLIELFGKKEQIKKEKD